MDFWCRQGQILNGAQFLGVAGDAAQGMPWYNQTQEEDGLLLKETIIKLYKKCISLRCALPSHAQSPLLWCQKEMLVPFFITALLRQSECLFSWKLTYPLSVLIFVRIILERFYLITSQLRTTFTLGYKAANYSVSGLQCAMRAVQFVGVSENF